MSKLSNAALTLADLGYAIFPCVPGTKKPLISRGCNAATSDLDQVEEWWSRTPNANIGLSTAGLLVVDIDAGATWLNDDPTRAAELSVAPLSLTARDGQQYFFRQPAGAEWNNSNSRLAPYVDIKVDGGYAVLPPSVYEGNRPYRWAPGMELDTEPHELPVPPQWLIDQLNDLSTREDAAPAVCENAIPSGQRNGTLARLAGAMRRSGMSQTEIGAALQETNRLRCRPPIDRDEVDSIAASIARYEPDQVAVAVAENHWEQMKRSEPVFQMLTSAELDAGQYELEYLINGILVRGQPSMIAGPKKTLKTNLSVEMALALSEAQPFLGKFDVKLSRRVGVMSGESGAATLQETARRIAKTKQLELSDCSNLIWCFDVPQLKNPDHIAGLRKVIEDEALDVLILDPTYLMMLELGGDAGNLFIVGSFLKSLGDLAHETGCTPILCHHLKKSIAEPYEPAELENIAWAGFQEFVRQWILLNRRVKYDPDQGGHHELWMSVGGSAGHSGLWGIDVEEGTRDDPGGRRWDVRVVDASEAYERRDESVLLACENKQERKKATRDEQQKLAVVEALRRNTGGETIRMIREYAGLRDTTVKKWINLLVEDGEVEECKVMKHTRRENGYRLVTSRGRSHGRI